MVIDQLSNTVVFSSNEKLGGIEVGGKVVFDERYKTVDFQDWLFKVENTSGEWNVCNASGAICVFVGFIRRSKNL